jgi:hypothetical protein
VKTVVSLWVLYKAGNVLSRSKVFISMESVNMEVLCDIYIYI